MGVIGWVTVVVVLMRMLIIEIPVAFSFSFALPNTAAKYTATGMLALVVAPLWIRYTHLKSVLCFSLAPFLSATRLYPLAYLVRAQFLRVEKIFVVVFFINMVRVTFSLISRTNNNNEHNRQLLVNILLSTEAQIFSTRIALSTRAHTMAHQKVLECNLNKFFCFFHTRSRRTNSRKCVQTNEIKSKILHIYCLWKWFVGCVVAQLRPLVWSVISTLNFLLLCCDW